MAHDSPHRRVVGVLSSRPPHDRQDEITRPRGSVDEPCLPGLIAAAKPPRLRCRGSIQRVSVNFGSPRAVLITIRDVLAVALFAIHTKRPRDRFHVSSNRPIVLRVTPAEDVRSQRRVPKVRVDSFFTAPPRADSRFSLAILLLHNRARSVAHRSPLGRPRLVHHRAVHHSAVPRGARTGQSRRKRSSPVKIGTAILRAIV